ncbi:MAG: hypothetical protein ABL951_04150 [Alphaproteobacteria bacterium]
MSEEELRNIGYSIDNLKTELGNELTMIRKLGEHNERTFRNLEKQLAATNKNLEVIAKKMDVRNDSVLKLLTRYEKELRLARSKQKKVAEKIRKSSRK